MRKTLLLSATVMLCLMLSACGNEETSPVTIKNRDSQEEVVKTQKDKKSNDNDDKKTKTQKNSNTMFPSQATIEETVLVDQDDVKITATGIDYTDTRATLHLIIENNADEDLSFLSGTIGYSMNTINDCVIPDGYLSSTVTPGMKALEDVYFDKSILLQYGIYDIAEIGMAFYVQNDDYDLVFKTDLITIPTSIYEQYDFTENSIQKAIKEGVWEDDLSMEFKYKNTDFVCSNDGLNINSAVIIENTKYDKTYVYLELENTADETVTFSASDITINGISVSSGRWDYYRIPAGKRLLADFNLDHLISEEYRSIISKDSIGEFAFVLQHVENDNLYEEISSADVSVVFDSNIDTPSVSGTPIYDNNDIKVYMLPPTVDDLDSSYYIPLFIENNYGAEICVDIDDDTFSMGGFMLDCTCFTEYIDDGGCGVIAIEIRKRDAEDLEINDIDDFTTATFKLEIDERKGYKDIDTPSLELNFQ